MPPQPAQLGAVADDHQRQPQRVEGAHGHVDALVRHQLGQHQVVRRRPAPAGREALELDRRVQHGRLAAEVAAHARGGQRASWRRRRSTRWAAIQSHWRQRLSSSRSGGRSSGLRAAQRRLALGPGVAERVVAVADVDRAGVDEDAVRPRARGGDHDVVAAQVQRLDRVRVERQQRPERARGRPQALQERRAAARGPRSGPPCPSRRRRR